MPPIDKHEAESLHREALHSIVHDMMAWLVEQRRLAKTQVNQCRTAKAPEKRLVLMQQTCRHKAFCDAVEKLKTLRVKHKEQNYRASVIGHELADGKAINDPTPEQISEARLEIQAKWSDSEREKRAGATTQPVEIRTVGKLHQAARRPRFKEG